MKIPSFPSLTHRRSNARIRRPAFAVLALSAILSLALNSQSLHAGNVTWLSTASTTAWATGGNWLGSTAPANDLTTDIAVFNQTSYTSQPNAGTRSVNGIIVGDGSTVTAPLTISTTALTIGASGITIFPSAGTVTATNSFKIGASQSWANNSSSLFTVGATVTNAGNATPFTLTLNGTGSGGSTFGGIISDGGSTGTTTLVVNTTAGVTTLSGANTFSGGTTIQSGTLFAITTGSSLGSGAVTLGNTTGSANATLLGGDGQTYSNNITVQAGSTSNAITLGNGGHGNTTATFSGNITLNHDLVVSIASSQSGNQISLTGTIAGNNALTFTGGPNRAAVLSGANTFSGGVTIASGGPVLTINNSGSVGTSSAIGLGTLTINGGGLNNTSGSAVTLSTNNAQTWNSDFTFVGSNDLNLGTGAVSLGAAAGTSRTITVTGAKTLTVGGVISNGSTAISLIESGSTGGILALTGANTFSGGVTITTGGTNSGTSTIAIGNDSAFGSGTITLGGTSTPTGGAAVLAFQSVDGTAHTIANPLKTSGTAETLEFGAPSGSGTGNLNFTDTTLAVGVSGGGTFSRTFIVNNTTSFANTFAGSSGSLIKTGPGAMILNSANSSYTGSTTVRTGTLEAGANAPSGSIGAFGNATTAVVLVDASSATTDNVGLLIGGAFTVGRNITVNSNNSSGTTTIGGNNAAATTALFTGTTTLNRGVTLVATTAGATTNFAGPITDGAGSFAVTTSGSGIVKLSASNSYHGGTTVSSGELLADNANGSATGSGAVTVLVSGSIGGSGSIAGALTINGALAPGDGGAGTLTINNTVALGNNASLLFDLDKPGVVAGTGSNDLLSILGTNGSNGGLTIGTGVTLGVTTGVDFSTGIYHLITYTGSLTDNSSAFTGWSIIGLPTGDTGSFSIGSNSIDLTVTSIPEPGTWGTLFAGFGMLIGFQCTRRRKS